MGFFLSNLHQYAILNLDSHHLARRHTGFQTNQTSEAAQAPKHSPVPECQQAEMLKHCCCLAQWDCSQHSHYSRHLHVTAKDTREWKVQIPSVITSSSWGGYSSFPILPWITGHCTTGTVYRQPALIAIFWLGDTNFKTLSSYSYCESLK